MDPLQLLLTVADTAGHTRHISVSGDLDVATAAQLSDMLLGFIEDGILLIVLDLTGVEFLDSSGLQVLVDAGSRLEARDGQLVIEGMSGAAQRILEITGLIDRYRRTPE